MSAVFASFLEELQARTAIEDCLKRFARAVDRQDWKAAREAYHDGAFDDHGFFKGAAGRVPRAHRPSCTRSRTTRCTSTPTC